LAVLRHGGFLAVKLPSCRPAKEHRRARGRFGRRSAMALHLSPQRGDVDQQYLAVSNLMKRTPRARQTINEMMPKQSPTVNANDTTHNARFCGCMSTPRDVPLFSPRRTDTNHETGDPLPPRRPP
jgi:hypothetical protein